jgi:hypothetical protein
VQQEVALDERIQGHLRGARLRQAVEELEELGAVGRQRGHALATTHPERRQTGCERVRPVVHLGEREDVVVHRAADADRRRGCTGAQDAANRFTDHLNLM